MPEEKKTPWEEVKYEEYEEFGKTSAMITIHIVISEGHVHIVPVTRGKYGANKTNRLPIREALILLEMLGKKDEAVALLKKQAVMLANGARQGRSDASDKFRDAMHRSGEQDAEALRILITLEETT